MTTQQTPHAPILICMIVNGEVTTVPLIEYTPNAAGEIIAVLRPHGLKRSVFLYRLPRELRQILID